MKDFSVRHIFLVVVAMFIHPRSGLLANDSDRQRLNEIAESLASHAVAQGAGTCGHFTQGTVAKGPSKGSMSFFIQTISYRTRWLGVLKRRNN